MYCNKCNQEKAVSDFYISKGVISKPCKSCRRKKANDRIVNIGKEPLNKRRRELWKKNYKRKNRVQLPDWVKKLSKNVYERSKVKGGKGVTSKHILLLYGKQQGKCYYTGIDMKIGDFLRKPSIDRVNSLKGYTTANVVLCCHSINLAKNNSSEKEFKKFLKELTK